MFFSRLNPEKLIVSSVMTAGSRETSFDLVCANKKKFEKLVSYLLSLRGPALVLLTETQRMMNSSVD